MSDLSAIDEQPTANGEPSGEGELPEGDRQRLLNLLRQSSGGPDARQRRSLRWFAIAFSVVLVLALCWLEYYILWCLIHTPLGSNDLFVVLCVAPIVAVTTIVVFMLIGVFRGFRESDLDSSPLRTALQAAMGGPE